MSAYRTILIIWFLEKETWIQSTQKILFSKMFAYYELTTIVDLLSIRIERNETEREREKNQCKCLPCKGKSSRYTHKHTQWSNSMFCYASLLMNATTTTKSCYYKIKHEFDIHNMNINERNSKIKLNYACKNVVDNLNNITWIWNWMHFKLNKHVYIFCCCCCAVHFSLL